MKPASERITDDVRALRRLRRRVVHVREQAEKLRAQLPAIPFSQDHAQADFDLSQATAALRRMQDRILDALNELQLIRLPAALAEELELMERELEGQLERDAIQAENKLASAPGFVQLRRPIQSAYSVVHGIPS